MAILERQVAIIKHQLAGLDTSQRVAIGLCAVLIAGSIMWLTQWSMQRELVPLHSEVLNEDELTGVANKLRAMGETFKEREGTIYVSPNDRRRLLMAVFESNVGPRNLSVTFAGLIKNNNVFQSESRAKWQQNIALGNELAMMMRESAKIRDAAVIIAGEHRRAKLGRPVGESTATVQVKMAPGSQMNPTVVQSIADLVAGAVSGLQPENVKVIDQATMRSYAVDDPEDDVGKKLYDLKKQTEHDLQSKIESLLGYIPGPIVSVSVKLEEETSDKVVRELGAPDPIRVFSEEDTQESLTAAAEPGVEANISAALSGGGAGQLRSKTKDETEFSENRDTTVITTSKKPGSLVEANASINLPRGYFVAALRANSGEEGSDPTTAEIDTYVEQQLALIQKQVETILAVAEKEPQVEVGVYNAAVVSFIDDAAISEQATVGGITQYLSGNFKQIGLGLLALMAMGMMLQTVRKTRSVTLPSEVESKQNLDGPLEELMVDSGAVGEAGSPDAFLIARETDEDSVRARQVAHQVTTLIQDDPEGAAQLVRRWIDREP